VGARVPFRFATSTHVGSAGEIVIGNNVTVERGGVISVEGSPVISEGRYVSVRANIGCEGNVNIGQRVATEPNCVIIDTNKLYSNTGQPIIGQGRDVRDIYVGDDCWIGANVVQLPGASLGVHCVVAAGSVVYGSVPANTVVGSVPARILRSLEPSDEMER